MEKQFDLQEHIEQWGNRIKVEPSVSERDLAELEDHLVCEIEKLKESGLDEDEAFIIATRRFDYEYDYGEEYGNVNKDIVQMRRSLIILAGVLIYFSVYYFIHFTSQLLFLGVIKVGGSSDEALTWVTRYIITWHFMSFIFFVSLYFLEKKTVTFLDSIKFKPRHAIAFLLITLLFALTNTCLLPLTNTLIGDNLAIRSNFHNLLTNFDFSFPFLICVCFIFVYSKYYKMTRF